MSVTPYFERNSSLSMLAKKNPTQNRGIEELISDLKTASEKRKDKIVENHTFTPHAPTPSKYTFTGKVLSNYQPWENDPRLDPLGKTIDNNNTKLQSTESELKNIETRIKDNSKKLFESRLTRPNSDVDRKSVV